MRWYYGWNIVAMCVLFQTVHWGMGSFTFTFWAVPWMEEFGASRRDIMMAPTAAVLMMGVFSPAVGWIMDRFSIRALLCAGSMMFVLAFALLSRVTAVWQIILIYGIFIAAGEALAGPMASQILTAKWFRARRGLALGIASTGTSAGAMLLPPIATLLLSFNGWREAQLMLALLPAILVMPLVWLVVCNSPAAKGVDPEPAAPDAEPSSGRHTAATERDWTMKEILADRGFQIIAMSFVIPNIAVYGIVQNLGPYAHELGFTATSSSAFVSGVGGGMLLGKLLFGALADRTDKRYLFWGAVGCLAIAISILLLQPTAFALMLLASLMVGFATGSAMPLTGALVGSRFSTKAIGRAMGLLYPFHALSAIGPVLTGWIRDQSGSYDTAFWAYLILIVPAALLMAFFPATRSPAPVSGEMAGGHREARS